jgi:hypothetical protein
MQANTENTERPNIEERYTSATDSSNLRLDDNKGGDADLLIAAGWSPSRLGAALMRLHSEWDGAEKPQRPTAQAIEALASTYPSNLPLLKRLAMAKDEAGQWYGAEIRRLVGKLKCLPAVRQQVAVKATLWKVAMPTEFAGSVLLYWLDQTCQTCDGRKWQGLPGAPGLSNKVCTACSGAGIARPPGGDDGRRMLNYIDECVGKGRTSIKNRLHNLTNGA